MIESIDHTWKRVLRGDAAAWGIIVRRFEALVNTVALRCGLNPTDAEDCAQYVWMLLYRNRQTIRDPHRLPKWLIVTTRRKAIRMVDQNRRRQTHTSKHDVQSTKELPDEAIERLERQAELEMALLQIDDRCRRLLQLLFFAPENKSYRDIAAELGLPMNSIGPTRARCLSRLRRIFDQMGIR